MSAEEIGRAFTDHWYSMRSSGNVDSLQSLFQPTSMMTFEGMQLQGPQAIIEKMKGLGNGGAVPFNVVNRDVQPSVTATSLVILVTGTISFDPDKPLPFSELIQLDAHAPGQYHVHNCIFRVCYMN